MQFRTASEPNLVNNIVVYLTVVGRGGGREHVEKKIVSDQTTPVRNTRERLEKSLCRQNRQTATTCPRLTDGESRMTD